MRPADSPVFVPFICLEHILIKTTRELGGSAWCVGHSDGLGVKAEPPFTTATRCFSGERPQAKAAVPGARADGRSPELRVRPRPQPVMTADTTLFR
jgi:hypothetical protein